MRKTVGRPSFHTTLYATPTQFSSLLLDKFTDFFCYSSLSSYVYSKCMYSLHISLISNNITFLANSKITILSDVCLPEVLENSGKVFLVVIFVTYFSSMFEKTVKFLSVLSDLSTPAYHQLQVIPKSSHVISDLFEF